jgi:hypothetical protein
MFAYMRCIFAYIMVLRYQLVWIKAARALAAVYLTVTAVSKERKWKI